MPNFDGGHYFLSSLIPIRQGLVASRSDVGNSFSHTHALREILSILPTQNPAGKSNPGEGPGLQNSSSLNPAAAPFSRDLRTHFCRMVVIDDLAFVGRQHEDAILTAIRKVNPVIPGPVDHLPNDFLALIIDFDAADDSEQTLKTYLQGLWGVMSRELTAIFQHCDGFDHSSPAESFVRQVIHGQVETTMSYNDYYWQGEPGLWQGSPSLPNKLSKVVGLPLAAAVIAVVAVCFLGPAGWLIRLVLVVAILGLTVLWLLQRMFKVGMEPFPTAPRSDLQSVLKALYLQRKFIDFMLANQGSNPQVLQANFSDFIRFHQPQSIAAPTQSPGCIPS